MFFVTKPEENTQDEMNLKLWPHMPKPFVVISKNISCIRWICCTFHASKTFVSSVATTKWIVRNEIINLWIFFLRLFRTKDGEMNFCAQIHGVDVVTCMFCTILTVFVAFFDDSIDRMWLCVQLKGVEVNPYKLIEWRMDLVILMCDCCLWYDSQSSSMESSRPMTTRTQHD